MIEIASSNFTSNSANDYIIVLCFDGTNDDNAYYNSSINDVGFTNNLVIESANKAIIYINNGAKEQNIVFSRLIFDYNKALVHTQPSIVLLPGIHTTMYIL